jgi:hypothetical protein
MNALVIYSLKVEENQPVFATFDKTFDHEKNPVNFRHGVPGAAV